MTDFRSVTGKGVVGLLRGTPVGLGNRALMDELKVPLGDAILRLQLDHAGKGRTAMFVAEGGKAIGLIAVSDPIKPSARSAIETLRADGIEVIMGCSC